MFTLQTIKTLGTDVILGAALVAFSVLSAVEVLAPYRLVLWIWSFGLVLLLVSRAIGRGASRRKSPREAVAAVAALKPAVGARDSDEFERMFPTSRRKVGSLFSNPTRTVTVADIQNMSPMLANRVMTQMWKRPDATVMKDLSGHDWLALGTAGERVNLRSYLAEAGR